MTTKKITALAAAALMSLSIAACGSEIADNSDTDIKDSSAAETTATAAPEPESEAETTTTAPPAESKAEETEPPLPYIGDEDAVAADYSIEITNGTEWDITGFYLRYADGEYSENLIPNGETFKVDELRQLNWTEKVEGEYMALGDFSAKITLDKDTSAVDLDDDDDYDYDYDDEDDDEDKEEPNTFRINVFPLRDMLSCELRTMDDYAFLVYTTKTGDTKDTMEKESEIAEQEYLDKMEKEAKKAAEKTTTTTTTTAPAETEPETETSTETQTETTTETAAPADNNYYW